MRSSIALFRVVPIKDINLRAKSSDFLGKCISEGFVFTDNILANYSSSELEGLFLAAKKELGFNSAQANASFHKSWKKIATASRTQLVIEQILHYYTTYGFEALGIYDKDSIYIPNETLNIPELEGENLHLTVIKGVTKEDLKKRLLEFLASGIALKDDTVKDVLDVASYVGVAVGDLSTIKNKETKIKLYDYLGIVPTEPIEFLRFIIYKSTETTLIIKNKGTIKKIKERENLDVQRLFTKYESAYGLEPLAKIFYRFKPLFLAFRTTEALKVSINKIRRLAVLNHEPMPEDYLNQVTAKLSRGERVDEHKLVTELEKVNTFRKIRLASALMFRSVECDSILYRIRNGKSYATKFKFENNDIEEVLRVVTSSIVRDIKKNVQGKKFYIPSNIVYALPATEKQFTGMFPTGTYVTVPKDLIFGVNWNNVNHHRIDLDLSLLSLDKKYGWDASYRSENRDVMFSGDVTDASGKNGASEMFYVKKQTEGVHLMMLNYFNYSAEIPVPTKIFVAQQNLNMLPKNYMVNPNNIVCSTSTDIRKQQQILGIVVTSEKENRFYFVETTIGKGITSSSDSEYSQQARKFLGTLYTNMISLNDILVRAGAIMSNKEDAVIDLSPENLTKDSILKLLI